MHKVRDSVIILSVQVGAVKIYVEAVEALRKKSTHGLLVPFFRVSGILVHGKKYICIGNFLIHTFFG
jgi:hypothetical protein